MTAASHDGEPGQEQLPPTPAPTPAPAQPAARHTAKRSGFSSGWVALALFAVVLVLLLVFILENSQSVEISFFGAHGHLPLGVALLLAAVLGIVLVVIAWFGRGVRVRAAAHRNRTS
jgi:lipopolysaccharide assembly protein A